MRALIVDLLCNSPFYDGAIVNALIRNGVEAELASPRFYLEPDYLDSYPRSPWLADLTVRFHRPRAVRLGTRAIEFAFNFSRLRHAIRAGGYDAVHVEWIPLVERQTTFMSVLRSACDHAKVPLVVTAHNVLPHDSKNSDRDTIRRNLDLAHLVIAHADHVAQDLRRTLGTDVPIVVIPHGPLFADLELPAKEPAKARLGLKGDPVVLFAGIMRPYKGIDLLTEAWPIVRAAYPDAALLVAGRALGPEAALQLRELAVLPGVSLLDRYLPLATMLACHAASDLAVFPYRAISQSGALMSALGLGRPAVVTPIAGFIEQAGGMGSVVVADEVTGAAIARAMIDALENRESLLATAAEDRQRVERSPTGWLAAGLATAREYEKAIASIRGDERRIPGIGGRE